MFSQGPSPQPVAVALGDLWNLFPPDSSWQKIVINVKMSLLMAIRSEKLTEDLQTGINTLHLLLSFQLCSVNSSVC